MSEPKWSWNDNSDESARRSHPPGLSSWLPFPPGTGLSCTSTGTDSALLAKPVPGPRADILGG